MRSLRDVLLSVVRATRTRTATTCLRSPKAVQLLSASVESSRLILVFLSDGAPSDHLFRECAHGVQVWQPLEKFGETKAAARQIGAAHVQRSV